MANSSKKTTVTTIILILTLALSAALATIPSASAKTTINVDPRQANQVGVNSETVICWTLNPDILITDPNYIGKTSAWPEAVITLTRPDGTKVVIPGPINIDPSIIGGENAKFIMYYTFDTMGEWPVNLYWPGDATYNPVNVTETWHVREHLPMRETWALLSIRPFPVVGLGQDILINAWVTPPPLTADLNFKNYMFTFTRPDGTSFQVGPMDSEGPATVWFNLPLDALGNWTIKFDFPGGFFELPCSVTRTITVQQEWVPGYPDTPLPTDRPLTKDPINFQNREWRTIAGMWRQSYYNASQGAWNPYTEAPKTAHILWKLPAYAGVGGFIGSPRGITTGGGQPEFGYDPAGLWSVSTYSITTIMAGRAYSSSGGNITCFDIRTGDILWQKPGSFSVGGVRNRLPVLYQFGTRLIAYDGVTGAVTLNVTGMSANFYDDPYVYTLSSPWLIKWDVTSTSTNFTSRIVWNVTNHLPTSGASGSYSFIQDGYWVERFTDPYEPASVISNNCTAVNLETGEVTYSKFLGTFNDPTTWVYRQGPAIGSAYGLVYFANIPPTTQGKGYIAIKASTGDIVWRSQQTDFPWGNFWAYMPQASGYGMIFGLGYTGVWAFNATNGNIVWHYIDNDTHQEEPYASSVITSDTYPNNLNLTTGEDYATYTFGSTGPIIGGGVVFAPNSEHSPTLYYRGMGMTAIDAFTGEKLWRILGSYSPSAIAYGVLTATDSVNGYTYAFGKGETETTVSPSSEIGVKGHSILLTGTVLDKSTAQPGTAAVSDDSQEGWMEYLHMQQPYPTNAKGVAVSLDALDPNNNYVHLGDATTDLTGKYSLMWTPEIEGKYTIIASFYNTEAYYGSTAETAVGIEPAPATVEPVEPAAPIDYTMTIIYVAIAIIAVIVVIGVLMLLMLRKR